MSEPRIVFMPHGNLQYSQLAPDQRGWVIDKSYERLFDLVRDKDWKVAFEASGFTVDTIAELRPAVMKKLKDLVQAGQIEPIASPYTHIMLSNIDPVIGLHSLRTGREAWERHTGVAPSVGWNPECSWASYIPEIYKEAGFEAMVMDGDSFFLSFPEIRKAAGLQYDVRGHSNKGKLCHVEEYIKDKPELLRFLTNPSVAPNGLKLISRSDMMANPMLWYLMGATEGVREQPIQPEEIRDILTKWKDRIAQTGSFIMPFAEDAEYIGTTAYFYVKQFGLAKFFEPHDESVGRFEEMLQMACDLGYTLSTPSEIIANSESILENPAVESMENGIAWHGGTAKAWANTLYARVLDPVCNAVFSGLKAIADRLGIHVDDPADKEVQEILKRLTASYVSDARWPPDPTSPGRFNVQEALDDLFAANAGIEALMSARGLDKEKSLYSPSLMKTQIEAITDELMAMPYFGEKADK
ncbi:MAG: glycoside hydrolase family 57 [Planctomycetes bacterium]|nr:glycoside hydrolase family 57 [Planctomycetota bacterium]